MDFSDTFTSPTTGVTPSSTIRKLGLNVKVEGGKLTYTLPTAFVPAPSEILVTYEFNPSITVRNDTFTITLVSTPNAVSNIYGTLVVANSPNVTENFPITPNDNNTITFTNISGSISSFSIGIKHPYFSFTIFNLTSTFVTCLSPETKVLTLSGYKEIQDLSRGELLPEGKIARIVEMPLNPEGFVSLTTIKKDSLQEGIPREDIKCCSDHVFIWNNKRILAKHLSPHTVVGKIKDLLSPAKDGEYKLLDVQFDFEGSYTASGLTSQTRSPYCKLTPLPKELYFIPENYKPILVDNTLLEYPSF